MAFFILCHQSMEGNRVYHLLLQLWSNKGSFMLNSVFNRHLACDEERVEAAKLLVEHGASIYIENKEEKTPLQLAKGGLGNLLRRIVEG